LITGGINFSSYIDNACPNFKAAPLIQQRALESFSAFSAFKTENSFPLMMDLPELRI
jgi:hypothetical protein